MGETTLRRSQTLSKPFHCPSGYWSRLTGVLAHPRASEVDVSPLVMGNWERERVGVVPPLQITP